MTNRGTWPAIAFVVLGVLTIGIGVYFMTLRPSLLPEDLRFTGLDRADIPHPLLPWLSIVFRTWGGFIVGLGLCVLGHRAKIPRGATGSFRNLPDRRWPYARPVSTPPPIQNS